MDLLQNTNQNDQTQIDPAKDYFQELVGEDKKFKTPQELARGKAESDAYIALQNKRMDELRADYLALRETHNAGPKLQELLDKISSTQQNSNSDNTMNANESQEKPVSLDTKQIEDLFSSKLQEHETFKKQQANFDKVQSKLKEQYGENYANVLKQQVDSMPGITANEVNELARKSPEAFFRLMGLDAKAKDNTFQSPPRSNQRSDNFAPHVQVRDELFYDKLKREQPTVYYDAKTQVQMHKDAQEMGMSFFKK